MTRAAAVDRPYQALPDRAGAHPGRRAQRMAGLQARHRAAHLLRQSRQPFRHHRRDGGAAMAGAPAHPSGGGARLLGQEQTPPLHCRDGHSRGADRPQAQARQRTAGAARAAARKGPVDPDLSRGHARRRRRGRRVSQRHLPAGAAFPDIELVPVYLDNLQRILPKGSMLPVPITCTARFGTPLRVEPGEDKAAFLRRARAAVLALSCAPVPRREPLRWPVNETLFVVLPASSRC